MRTAPSGTRLTYAAVAANISCRLAVVHAEQIIANIEVNPRTIKFFLTGRSFSYLVRTKTGPIIIAVMMAVKKAATTKSNERFEYRQPEKYGSLAFAACTRVVKRNWTFISIQITGVTLALGLAHTTQ